MTRPHARGVEERAAGAARAIHDRFGEGENLLAIVRALFPRVVDQAAPTVTNADDLVAVAESANRDGADGVIEPRDVAAAGEDADSAFAHWGRKIEPPCRRIIFGLLSGFFFGYCWPL